MRASDKRRTPKLVSPKPGCGRYVGAYMDPGTYRKFYEIVMTRGVSGSDALRDLVAEEFERMRDE